MESDTQSSGGGRPRVTSPSLQLIRPQTPGRNRDSRLSGDRHGSQPKPFQGQEASRPKPKRSTPVRFCHSFNTSPLRCNKSNSCPHASDLCPESSLRPSAAKVLTAKEARSALVSRQLHPALLGAVARVTANVCSAKAATQPPEGRAREPSWNSGLLGPCCPKPRPPEQPGRRGKEGPSLRSMICQCDRKRHQNSLNLRSL